MIRRDNKLIFLTDSFIWFPFLDFELFLSLMNDRSISSCNQPDLSACRTSTRAARAAGSTAATTVTIPPELAQLAMAKAVARDMRLEQFVQDAIRRMAELPDPWELFADVRAEVEASGVTEEELVLQREFNHLGFLLFRFS